MFLHKILKKDKRKRQNGFTFLEILISLMVLAVGALTMLQAVNVAMNANFRATNQIIASNLAHALMAEILVKNFVDVAGDTNIGPDLGEVRFAIPPGNFDDVDDYDALVEGVSSVPRTITNQLINPPNYPVFTRNIRVRWVTSLAPDNELPIGDPQIPTNLKRIVVTVRDASGNVLYELIRNK